MQFQAHNVVNVKPKGIKKVIDLEMKSKSHNFLANGMVVGNSHALCYSFISARCLYLKVHYPAEYYAATLSHLKTGATEKRVKEYIQDGRLHGLIFESCDINRSKLGFKITGDNIIIGFNKIKGINKEAEKLIDLQPFSSFEDYIDRYGINKKTGETLIYVGAFDSLEPHRKILLEYFNYRRDKHGEEKGVGRIQLSKIYKNLTGEKSCPKTISEKINQYLEEGSKRIQYSHFLSLIKDKKIEFPGVDSEKLISHIDEHKNEYIKEVLSLEEFKKLENIRSIEDYTYKEKCELEFEYYTFYFNHPMDNFQREGYLIGDCLSTKCSGKVEGLITHVETKIAKNNNPYYTITLEDEFDQIKVLLWGDQYNANKNCIIEGLAIRIDITPSKFAIWNMSKIGSIERIKSNQEPTDEQERETRSEFNFNKFMDELINKGE